MTCAWQECVEASVGKSKYCRAHRAEARDRWLEKVKASDAERAAKHERWAELAVKADAAGREAASTCVPTPMVVAEHANMLDDASPVKRVYHVEGGVCGFAWIVIRPGNCSFAHYAKKHLGAEKGYYKGVSMWVMDYGQSMQRKEAYARAYAAVLREAGIRAAARSRMD